MTIFTSPLLAFFTSGGWEWLIVLGVFVLLFGGSKLPSLMRNLGRSVNEFKAGIKETPADAAIDAKPEEEAE